MNVIGLQEKLIAAARASAPDDRVPYAFEKRVMALIGAGAVADSAVVWVAPSGAQSEFESAVRQHVSGDNLSGEE